MKKPIMSQFDFASYSDKHVKLKEFGLESWDLFSRNVIDEFKGLTDEEIRVKLKETANPFAAMFENWQHSLNIGLGLRNCNCFNAMEAFYVGYKRWDRRSALGCQNYSRMQFVETLDQLVALKDKYIFIAVDNLPGAKPIEDYAYPTSKPVMLVFGEEGTGLTPQMRELCDDMIYISQFGSIRSLNAASSSGIVFYDFVTKHNRKVVNK